jgi:spore coat polysaccharide biosynthesis protein SpsF
VLADLGGAPMLAREIERVRRASRVDDVVIATTTNREDDGVVAVAEGAGARWFRGSEHDVLGRMAGAAREARADIALRLTADCPFLDPGVIDRAVALLEESLTPLDYVTTEPPATFPRGIDVEVLHADVLARVDRMARSRAAREHVTFFIYGEEPTLFRAATLTDTRDNSAERWTVDTPDDLALVRALWSALDMGSVARSYEDILAYLQAHPELRALNAHVPQRAPGAEP